MSKYLRRLAAKNALNALRESAKEGKSWIVSKKLILETEDENLELDAGDTVDVGATPDGDMVVDGQAAVVVITDADLASKIADVVVSADEMSDVKFVEKPALDAVLDGEEVDDVVDKLGDDEGDDVEVAEVDIAAKESVEAKFAKFSANRMNPEKYSVCESILVDEEAGNSLNLAIVKKAGARKESFNDYNKFVARVSEMKGSLQPGKREIALTEAGEVMGSYDTEADTGALYPDNSFKSVDEMDAFKAEAAPVMNDVDLGDETLATPVDATVPEYVESCLKKYEESAKSGKDYVELVKGLEGLKESTVAMIVESFDQKALKECVRVHDSKYGKYVAAFNESVDADNFIAEAEEAGRFTKRFFA